MNKKQTSEHKKKRLESFLLRGKNLGPRKDLTGERFGRLVVLGYAGRYMPPGGSGQSTWLCQCDCGISKVIQQSSLISGTSLSCKCLNNENARRQGLKNAGKNNGMYGKMSGPDNPNWHGGTSSERDAISATDEYKGWRRAVYKRDDYTCQVCSERGCRLHAHHILPFSKFPEYRYEIENGLTLCEDCHKYAGTPITKFLHGLIAT